MGRVRLSPARSAASSSSPSEASTRVDASEPYLEKRVATARSGGSKGRAIGRPRVSLDEPAPAIMAEGIGFGNRSQHALVGAPPDPGVDVVAPAPSSKPPFRMPSMQEVANVEGSNGLTIVSTFSGCGGSCLGFKMAGYRVAYANEFVKAARDTYELNHTRTFLDDRDIRAVRPEEILERVGVRKGELDLLEGSPPCASFSTAGNRDKDWGKVKTYSDTKQRTDDLFFEYARLLRGMQPRAFVAENVSGLVKGNAYGYFVAILEELQRCGYRVKAKVLDAQWLGVPQTRQRLIFVGVRNDLGVDPVFPRPLPYFYSMRDALPHLRRVRSSGHGFFDGLDVDGSAPAPTIPATRDGAAYYRHVVDVEPTPEERRAARLGPKVRNFHEPRTPNAGDSRLVIRDGFHAGATHSVDAPAPTVMAAGIGGVHRTQMIVEEPGIDPTEAELEEARGKVEGYAIGREYDKTPLGGNSEKFFNLARPNPVLPVPTITAIGGGAGVASVVHPLERRKFTIRELRRLCAFPDDFQLTGDYGKQWERLGRSVPPRMMYHVAAALRDGVFRPLGLVSPDAREAP